MADLRKPTAPQPHSPTPSPPESEPGFQAGKRQLPMGSRVQYPNPPDVGNPDAATLREQWRFAIRQYSKWYSHAWGTAIVAGLSFFALGWVIKGSNPLPSSRPQPPPPPADDHRNDVAPGR